MNCNVKNYKFLDRVPGTIYYFRSNNWIEASHDFLYLIEAYRDERTMKNTKVDPKIFAIPTYNHPYMHEDGDYDYMKKVIHISERGTEIISETAYDKDSAYFMDYRDEYPYHEKINANISLHFDGSPVTVDNIDKVIHIPGTVYITENGYASYDLQDAINHLKPYRDNKDQYKHLTVYGFNFFNISMKYSQEEIKKMKPLDRTHEYIRTAQTRRFELSLDRTHIYKEFGVSKFMSDYYIIDMDLVYGGNYPPEDVMYRIKDQYKDLVDQEFRNNIFYLCPYSEKTIYAELGVSPCTISLNRPYDRRRKRKLLYSNFYTDDIPYAFFEPHYPIITIDEFLESDECKPLLNTPY